MAMRDSGCNPEEQRFRMERAFHDDKYTEQFRGQSDVQHLVVSNEYDPFDDPNLRSILSELPQTPSRILELGCGVGIGSVAAALQGANVIYTDISEAAVNVARQRLDANRLASGFGLVTASEYLPLPDDSIDFVYCVGVLHHLDLQIAGVEIHRVLKPGARGVFIEPLGLNPFLNYFRYRFTEHTPDERMLTYSDIDLFCRGFAASHVKEFQLISMLHLILPSKPMRNMLERADYLILKHLKFAKRFCRLVEIQVSK